MNNEPTPVGDATANIEVRGNARDVYERFREERRRQLIGVEDDMWATFADQAEPHAVLLAGNVVGCCAIDDERQLHALHVEGGSGDFGSEILDQVVDDRRITAAIVATVDPYFLSLGLSAGGSAEPLGLMYEHTASIEPSDGLEARRATPDDHKAAAAFCEAATRSDGPFLDAYLAERIEQGELYLVEDDSGHIIASGECRVDQRTEGYAHLGLIVGAEVRSRGLGSRLMYTLTRMSSDNGLAPLCSTEPTNLAAQRVIHRAGFRSRHRVFRVPLAASRSRNAAGSARGT